MSSHKHTSVVVPLRARLFLAFFMPLLVLEILVGGYFYQRSVSNLVEDLRLEDHHQAELEQQVIRAEFKELLSDLEFLSINDELVSHLNSGSAANRESVKRFFQQFSDVRGKYAQIRYIDETGMEQVRVDLRDGTAVIIPAQELQNKAGRYYFADTMTLEKGKTLLSPFDLNVEQGEVERPLKPMLRIATPLFNESDERRGILILNYLGSRLLHLVHKAHKPTEGCRLSLLNHNGYWLHSDDPGRSWGFMLEDRARWHLGNTQPETWTALQNDPAGHTMINGHMLTWASVYPRQLLGEMAPTSSLVDASGSERDTRWILLVSRSPENLSAATADLRINMLIPGLLLALLFAAGSLVLAFSRAKTREAEHNENLLMEARTFTNDLLRSGLEDRSLAAEMQLALEKILTISWVSILSKGSIFLTDEETNELVMVAEKDLAKPLLTLCARLKMGQCLCGKAAESGKIVFKNCLDGHHEITFDGIPEHGHICTPILKGDKVLGVINLYVEHGHRFDPLYEDLLTTIANAMAGVIERKKTDQLLEQTRQELERQRDGLASERAIVEETLAKIRDAENFDSQDIRYLMSSVDNTAGDILLSSTRPDGVRQFLLGDFTGHGLPSAMASPTVADMFYSMTEKGLPPEDLIYEINNKLFQKLPTQLFLVACLVTLNEETGELILWNAGLPEPLLFRNDKPLTRITGGSIPLGILEELPDTEWHHTIETKPGDRLFVYSDGVIEIDNEQGEMFGKDRLEQSLAEILASSQPLEELLPQLDLFQGSAQHEDDITLLEVNVG